MAKTLAIVFGIVFVLVGILGFMGSGIAGPMGVFQTNTLHDLVHLLFGLILLVVAFTAPAGSAKWLKILGIVYLVLAVLGFLLIPSGGLLLGIVLMNGNDHWLHLVLGIVLVIAGMSGRKSGVSGGMPMSSPSM
ncbi:MAG: hypothetical protein QOE22_72 [Candidatus Parcubacteria bacterium]|jgi:hypothetical protein|nr:hypothetical protein [Candidatus Parcubacteria bacterium]